MSKTVSILKTLLRVAIGLIFIVSAVLKLLSLDSFEIYIYSFNIFGFVLSGLVARCVIAADLLLGAFFIAKILYKPTWWLMMAMLLGFTLLMVYVAIFRDDTNCHCMGEIVPLKPAWTIVKNVVLMLLMLLVCKEGDYHFRGKKAVGIILAVVSVLVPFALFPMDGLYNAFSRGEHQVNTEKFDHFMQDSIAQSFDISKGNYILGYLASGCEFCKLSAKKIDQMFHNNNLDSTRLIFFIWGPEKSVKQFREETKTEQYRYSIVNPVEALNIVYGEFPTYVYIHDGQVVKAANLREMEESFTVEFLEGKK